MGEWQPTDEERVKLIECERCGRDCRPDDLIDGLCEICYNGKCQECGEFFEPCELTDGICEECLYGMRWEIASELSLATMSWIRSDAREKGVEVAHHLETLLRELRAEREYDERSKGKSDKERINLNLNDVQPY